MTAFDNAFLRSATSLEGAALSTGAALEWLHRRAGEVPYTVTETTFSSLRKWSHEPARGTIAHESGRFFSIEGIRVTTNWGGVPTWDQPIINQPEVGYLGVIARPIDGVLHFLMQAKIEPGNINGVQLSPTLQATRSNFTRIHNGATPRFLEIFRDAPPRDVVLDQLQSEQGARFLRKRNRNIVVCADLPLDQGPDFQWLTLGQIKALAGFDNVVNMDTRTVISTMLVGDGLEPNAAAGAGDWTRAIVKSAATREGRHSMRELLRRLTVLKTRYDLDVQHVPLGELRDWELTDTELRHKERRFFRILPIQVSIFNREVTAWDQPMLQPAQEGLCAFVCKMLDGVLHFIVQGKLECGNRDVIELAPTVQCLTGSYRSGRGTLPFLDYVLEAPAGRFIVDTRQSEEGGRFYKEVNRNCVILAEDDFPEELPDNYMWASLGQLHRFMEFNNYVNIQARSLLAVLPFC